MWTGRVQAPPDRKKQGCSAAGGLEGPYVWERASPKCQAEGHCAGSREGGTPQFGQVLTVRYPTLRPGPDSEIPHPEARS